MNLSERVPFVIYPATNSRADTGLKVERMQCDPYGSIFQRYTSMAILQNHITKSVDS